MANNRAPWLSPASCDPRRPGWPGALQRYFEIALYLLVFTGFGTLASTGGLGIGTVLLVSCALLLRGYLLLARAVPG